MRNVDTISTGALGIDTDDLLHVLFHKITRAELQELYDYCGTDARYLKQQLGLSIGTKRFARKLLDGGVTITSGDLHKAQAERKESLEQGVVKFDIGDSFDPEEMMKEAAELRLDPTIFNKMDFRELPNPKNILDWVTGREFLDSSPYPRQLEIALGLTEEFCPACSDMKFVKDMHLSPFLGEDGVHNRPWTIQEILERITLLEHGVCPKCHRTYNEMLAAGLHRFPNDLVACCGQRCVAGDTLIVSSDGVIPIRDLLPEVLPEPDTFVPLTRHLTVPQPGLGYDGAVSDGYYAGVGPAKRITTELGFSLTGSLNHPIRTLGRTDGKLSWQHMENVVEGDLVLVVNGHNTWGDNDNLMPPRPNEHGARTIDAPPTMTPPVARLLGYIVAEGSFATTSDPCISADVISTIRSLGLHAGVYGSCPYDGVQGLFSGKEGPSNNIQVTSRILADWLHESCGLAYATAHHKQIPTAILRGSVSIICHFLAGMYEGDGCIIFNEKSRVGDIKYSTVSRTLATQLQVVLGNLGILASITEEICGEARGGDPNQYGNHKAGDLMGFVVHVTEPRQIEKFVRLIPFISKYRKARARAVLAFVERSHGHRILYGSRGLIMALFRKALNINSDDVGVIAKAVSKSYGSDVRGRLFQRVMHHHNRGRYHEYREVLVRVVLDLLRPLGHHYEWKMLHAMCNGRVFAMPIKAIQDVGNIPLFCMHVPGTHRFVGNGILQRQSGKTILSAFLGSYYNARFQLLRPTPQKFFGEESKQKFTAIYTAINLTQSTDTLWGAYHAQIKEAPWYKTYHDWLSYYGKKHGAELFRIQETQHIWGPTLIQDRLLAPFALNMRGRTGYAMGIDEIGLFNRDATSIKANADEVYITMSNACLTIRTAADELNRRGIYTPTAPMFCISSPWELLDKIMRMVREAPKMPRRVAYQFATWDMNWKIRRDSPEMVSAFAADEIKANRDFGAVPPLADNPFHNNEAAIDALPAKDGSPYFVQSLKRHTAPTGDSSVYAVPTHVRADIGARILCLDSGESNNSFALTMWGVHRGPPPLLSGGMGYVVPADGFEDDDERNAIAMASKPPLGKKGTTDGTARYLRCDGIIEVAPPEDCKVNFKFMYDLCILPIIRSFKIIAMVSDRWNMSQIVHSLQEEGVVCHQYTPNWNDFRAFREKTNRREVVLPKLERPYATIYDNFDEAVKGAPGLHLLVQMKTVRQAGRQVVKPKGGTDDLYRTAVLAHRFAMNEDPKDVAVTTEGIPYAIVLEKQSRIIPGYGGDAMGLVMLRRDADGYGNADIGPKDVADIGGYRSYNVRTSNKRGPGRGRI